MLAADYFQTSQISRPSTSLALLVLMTPLLVPSPIARSSCTDSPVAIRCSTSWTTPSWACEYRTDAAAVSPRWHVTRIWFCFTQIRGEHCHSGQQRQLHQHVEHAPLQSKTWSGFCKCTSVSESDFALTSLWNRIALTRIPWLSHKQDSVWRPRFMLLLKPPI